MRRRRVSYASTTEGLIVDVNYDGTAPGGGGSEGGGEESEGGEEMPGVGYRGAAWGYNAHYELGVGVRGDKGPRGVTLPPSVVQFAPFLFCNMALLADRTAYVVGDNRHAQRCVGSWQLPGMPQWTKVPLARISAITACGAHALVMLRDRTVRTWGPTTNGVLGTGTPDLVALFPVGTREMVLANETFASTPQKPALTGIIAIASGDTACLALDSNGVPWGWGGGAALNMVGNQLRPVAITGLPPIVGIAVGARHCLFLTADGRVFGLGNDQHGQLCARGKAKEPITQFAGVTTAKAIAAGAEHSHIVLANGKVLSAGGNGNGALGIGTADNEPHGTLVESPLPGGKTADYIATGPQAPGSVGSAAAQCPVFVVCQGQLVAWGCNRFGNIDPATGGVGHNVLTPTIIPTASPVLSVAGSEYDTAAVFSGSVPEPPVSYSLTDDETKLVLDWSWPESSGEWQVRIGAEPSPEELEAGTEPPTTTIKLGKSTTHAEVALEAKRGYSVTVRNTGNDSTWPGASIDTALLGGYPPMLLPSAGIGSTHANEPRVIVEPANLAEYSGANPSAPPKVGLSACAVQGEWGRATFDYGFQWLRDGVPLLAKGRRYTIRPDDVGHALSVRVTATNPWGSTQATSQETATVLA